MFDGIGTDAQTWQRIMQNTNTNRNVEKASSIRLGQHHSWSIPTSSTPSASLILRPPPPPPPPPPLQLTIVIVFQLQIGEYRFGPSVFCRARTLSIGHCEFCCGLFCLQKVEYFHLTVHCVRVLNVIVGLTQVALFTRYLVCSSANPLHVLGDLRSISPRNPNLRKSCMCYNLKFISGSKHVFSYYEILIKAIEIYGSVRFQAC